MIPLDPAPPVTVGAAEDIGGTEEEVGAKLAIYVLSLLYGHNLLHLFSFKTPIIDAKKRKWCKINSRNFTYDGLTLSRSFSLEPVKDEI